MRQRRDFFQTLYVAAGDGGPAVPWDRGGPHRLLEQWAELRRPVGTGKQAVVVGSGLGADAEFVARLGFATVGFDFAPAAVAEARRRFPDSPVEYVVADLLDPPAAWREAYDLVVESLTVQSLPPAVQPAATARVRELVAPGGTLVVISGVRGGPDDPDPEDGPWRLGRAELESFAAGELRLRRVDRFADPDATRWRAELRRDRPAPAGPPGRRS